MSEVQNGVFRPKDYFSVKCFNVPVRIFRPIFCAPVRQTSRPFTQTSEFRIPAILVLNFLGPKWSIVNYPMMRQKFPGRSRRPRAIGSNVPKLEMLKMEMSIVKMSRFSIRLAKWNVILDLNRNKLDCWNPDANLVRLGPPLCPIVYKWNVNR